jgi:hypothetical protein
MRAVIVGLGVAVLGYGGWLLLSRQDLVDVREVVLWAAVAVVLHDAVLAPLVLALGWVARRLVAGRLAAAAVVVLVVLGPVALAAIPVLGRYGTEPGNATLLARDYPQGLIVVALVAVVAATVLALAGLVSEEERGRSSGGPGPRRR